MGIKANSILGGQAKAEPQGNHRRKGRSLAVDQLGNDDQHNGIRPGIVCNHGGKVGLDDLKVGVEKAVCHPGHAKNRENGHHARLEYGAVGDGLLLDLAEHENARASNEHDHLDDNIHGERLCLARCSKARAQLGERAKYHHGGNGEKEEYDSPVSFGRKHLVHERAAAAVNVGPCFRILQFFLKFRVIVQILAPVHGPQARAQHTHKGGGNGNGQQSDDADGRACPLPLGQHGNHGNHRYGHR